MVFEIQYTSYDTYVEAWRMLRTINVEFTYNREAQSISVETNQFEDPEWPLYRLQELKREENY